VKLKHRLDYSSDSEETMCFIKISVSKPKYVLVLKKSTTWHVKECRVLVLVLVGTVATSRLALCWMCDLPQIECAHTHIYVVRTSNNRVIMACDLYCCLLAQCEALRTCCLGFLIATVQWYDGTDCWQK